LKSLLRESNAWVILRNFWHYVSPIYPSIYPCSDTMESSTTILTEGSGATFLWIRSSLIFWNSSKRITVRHSRDRPAVLSRKRVYIQETEED